MYDIYGMRGARLWARARGRFAGVNKHVARRRGSEEPELDPGEGLDGPVEVWMGGGGTDGVGDRGIGVVL